MPRMKVDLNRLDAEERQVAERVLDEDGKLKPHPPEVRYERTVTHVTDPPGPPKVDWEYEGTEARYLWARLARMMGRDANPYRYTRERSVTRWLDAVAEKMVARDDDLPPELSKAEQERRGRARMEAEAEAFGMTVEEYEADVTAPDEHTEGEA